MVHNMQCVEVLGLPFLEVRGVPVLQMRGTQFLEAWLSGKYVPLLGPSLPMQEEGTELALAPSCPECKNPTCGSHCVGPELAGTRPCRRYRVYPCRKKAPSWPWCKILRAPLCWSRAGRHMALQTVQSLPLQEEGPELALAPSFAITNPVSLYFRLGPPAVAQRWPAYGPHGSTEIYPCRKRAPIWLLAPRFASLGMAPSWP